jgi:hypothetical protein
MTPALATSCALGIPATTGSLYLKTSSMAWMAKGSLLCCLAFLEGIGTLIENASYLLNYF